MKVAPVSFSTPPTELLTIVPRTLAQKVSESDTFFGYVSQSQVVLVGLQRP